MEREELQKYLGTGDMSVVEAMQKIDRNAKGVLYITDEQGKLLGSLTDGDIRRWIIKTADLDGRASDMMHRGFCSLPAGEQGRAMGLMEQCQINSIPITGPKGQVIDIVIKSGLPGKEGSKREDALRGIPVIVMAGGKGTRLYPFTKILPKPLIPIGDVPILERILDAFFQYGANEFYLMVNYKKEMIRSYFHGQKVPYRLHYVDEDRPLGTAGSIGYIDEEFHSPVVITNCDTLIESDYGEIMGHHKGCGNGMTVVSSLKNTTIPYGVIHSKGDGLVSDIEEKPKLSYFINTGMYIVDPEYLQEIPKGEFFHMTDLAAKLIREGVQVGMYPISENSFLDMGEFEEMKKMEERINGRQTEAWGNG
ncbi:CBS domain-containing protein [Clostridiaceae bacterium]|nr:CBS domain-containing protein [Clostridiaceae bacterium]RKI08576.1 CBS domain-containing protein [bacterium 1XD21-70]